MEKRPFNSFGAQSHYLGIKFICAEKIY